MAHPRPRGVTILFLLLLLHLTGACGESTPAPTALPTSAPSPQLRVAAAPSARALLERWIGLFQEERPGVALEVLPYSAVQAQEALSQGRVHLAYLDQPPASFYRGVLTATQVASEPIAVVVHPENPLGDLSLVAMAEILSGRVGNWSRVGGEDRPVQVYLRAHSTGEVQALAEALAGRHLAPQAIVRASAASLQQAVAEDPGGIGVLPAGDVTGEVRVLRVDGMMPAEAGYFWHMPLFLVQGPGSPAQALAFIRWLEVDYSGGE